MVKIYVTPARWRFFLARFKFIQVTSTVKPHHPTRNNTQNTQTRISHQYTTPQKFTIQRFRQKFYKNFSYSKFFST